MGGPKTWLERNEWHSLVWQTRPSTSVSRIHCQDDVCLLLHPTISLGDHLRLTRLFSALTHTDTLVTELGKNPSRHVELDIDIGADAQDWSAIQATEKLKPVERELRRIEETVKEIVEEMEYLRVREQKLRDTNESTNERVKWFAFGTMGMLVGLGAWQVVYLRAYFR